MMSDFVAIGPSGGARQPSGAGGRGAPAALALHLTGIAALAIVLVTSDAFGSDRLSLGRQLLMFAIVSTLLVGQASLLAEVARRAVRSSRIGPVAAAALALAATLALMTVELDLLKATPVLPYKPDPLPAFALFLAPFVIPVSAFVLALRWLAVGERHSRVARPSTPVLPAVVEAPGEPAPIDGPDGWPAAAVLRVRADDHYLQLWTSRGSLQLRGRMRDALRRLPAGAGVQPHRSWWVALAEVDRIERRGRDLVLRLNDGDGVPLARSRAREVRELLHGRRAGPPDAVSGS